MEKRVLQQFIREFLPPSDRFIKGNYNQIAYVWETINRAFLKYIKIEKRIEVDEVIAAFKQLNYQTFENKNMRWGTNRIHMRPIVYIKIFAKDIKLLRTSLASLPEHTSAAKRKEVTEMIKRLKAFNEYRQM